MIQAGAPAPDFELPDHDAQPVRLSSLRGGYVVIYFYPKATCGLPIAPGASAARRRITVMKVA